MNKSILITGIAGTGKSSICNKLIELGYRAFSIEDRDELYTRIDRRTGQIFKDYNANDLSLVKQANWICDRKKLRELIRKNNQGIVFYCGVASNLDYIRPLFDKVFMLKASIDVLHKRLSRRSSNDFARSSEVQNWLFKYKLAWENHMSKGAIVINASNPLNEVVSEVIKKSKII